MFGKSSELSKKDVDVESDVSPQQTDVTEDVSDKESNIESDGIDSKDSLANKGPSIRIQKKHPEENIIGYLNEKVYVK